jgi:hypothetical protein
MKVALRQNLWLFRRICGCDHPFKVSVSSAFHLEGGRCRRPALGPMGQGGIAARAPLLPLDGRDWIASSARLPSCAETDPSKMIARETREILCLSVSCHASTAVNDLQFLQRTLYRRVPPVTPIDPGRWASGARHRFKARPFGHATAEGPSTGIRVCSP